MISTDKVHKQALAKLQQLYVQPRSIQGTPLTYHGFLKLDICIGGKIVTNQRFHIVDNLVCPFVAGIDLISSLGLMCIEWGSGTVCLQHGGTFRLSHEYEPPESSVKVPACKGNHQKQPAFSEATITAKASFMGEGSFEPQLAARHDYLGAARGIFPNQ